MILIDRTDYVFINTCLDPDDLTHLTPVGPMKY